MEFPAFAGKTYDFIIFQGSQTLTEVQDTIPANGKFSIQVPQDYAPYTGMSRWLITGTTTGGGLFVGSHLLIYHADAESSSLG